MKSRSRENIARLDPDSPPPEYPAAFHVARPATIISSSSLNSSNGGVEMSPSAAAAAAGSAANSPNNNSSSSSSHNSHHVVSVNNRVPPPTSTGSSNSTGNMRTSPPSADMDWTSLVDTATKAMLEDETELANGGSGGVAAASGQPTLQDLRRAMERVCAMEAELGAERAEKAGLLAEVEQLKAENIRLQVRRWCVCVFV